MDVKTVKIEDTNLAKLITFKQGIDFLGISAVTAWEWERDGKIRIYRIGRRRFFDTDELFQDIKKADEPATMEGK